MINTIKSRIFLAILVFLCLGTNVITLKAENISTIDSTTFRGNYKISTVHIGSDVSEITSTAFRNLVNLREITVSGNNPYYASFSGCLYDKEYSKLLCFPPALSGAVIPDSVVSIGENALHGVPDYLKVQIREVVEEQALENIPESEIPGEHFVHTDTGVKWKKYDGTVIPPDSDIMGLAAAVVDASSNKNMTRPQQLEAAFNYVVQAVSYERSLVLPEGDWVREYAIKTLGNRKANCYGYAAAFAYIARGLGYDAKVCTGTVKSSLGGRTVHAWTEVKIGKNWYVFDTEMQNAKGTGYYKQTYETYPAGPLEKESTYVVEF